VEFVRVNYFSDTLNKEAIKIYNDGLKLNWSEKKDAMVNSKMPLYIGNWIGKNRPFNGVIKEIKISNRSLSREDIISNWRDIQHKVLN
jgi:hypothetical protein